MSQHETAKEEGGRREDFGDSKRKGFEENGITSAVKRRLEIKMG